ncbi:MAG TPA: Calx-beta domain-containing protein [Patescibacteria group bacterium]|nr:Calx-beta domain-containing protein [Patescibacteria group bacterium]
MSRAGRSPEIAWSVKINLCRSLVALLLFWVIATASAQWVAPDSNFPTNNGPDYFVRNIVLQADGQILIAGLFTNVDGVTHPHFARLTPAGQLDATFAPNLDQDPTHVELLSDQRILISGAFTNVNGVARPGLAILLPDGSLDETFTPPAASQTDTQLNGLSAFNSQVIVAGSFTNLGGISRNHVARLMSSGAVDSAFNSPFDRTNTVTVQFVQSDGKPIISGAFSNVAGVAITNLVRLNTNGSVDTTFSSGLDPSEQVLKAWAQPDGRLLVLTRYANSFLTWIRRLVRLEADGALDPSFNPSFEFPGFPFSGTISSLSLQPDGKILLGGNFLRVNGMARAGVARLLPDGTLDFCFDVALSDELFPFAIATEPSGNVLVGGTFNGLQGQFHPYLMRLVPPPGCVPGQIELGVSNLLSRGDSPNVVVPVVRTAGEDREESVDFTTRDGSAVAGVDYVAVSGTVHFASGQRSQSIAIPLHLGAASNGPVNFELSIAQPGGGATLGLLTNASITLTPSLRGTAGSPDTNYLVHLDGPVRFILPLTNGAVFLVGDFTNVDGQLCPNVVRLQPDGTRDPAFIRATPLDGLIQSATLDPQGRVLIAGYFQHVDGQWRPALARFGTDGALDAAFGLFDQATNSLGYVAQAAAVCVLADGSIVCGVTLPGTTYYSTDQLLKFSPGGQVDLSFTSNLPPELVIGALRPLPDGDFFAISAGLGSSVVRLHGDGTLDLNFVPPADSQFTYYAPNSLGILADGRVTVAGMASAYYGLPNQPPLWRLNRDGSFDTGFSLPATFGTFGRLLDVNAMDVALDARVLVAGFFENGSYGTLGRFLADGSPDFSFDSGVGFAARPLSSVLIRVLQSMPRGGWLAGGDFGSYDGFNQPYLVRILPEQISRPLTFEISVTNLTVWETNGPVTMQVTRTGDASTAASVLVATQDGTALAGQDYTQVNTRLEFAPGEWTKTLTVSILDDKIAESLEQFTVQLSDPSAGFSIGPSGSMTIQITDDDAGVEFVAPQFNALEEDGYALVGVKWTGLLSTGLTAVVNVTPVTGKAGDLGALSAKVTYTSGITNWVRFPIIDNPTPDGLRQFTLQLVGSPNLVPGPQSEATLVLRDSDFPTSPARGVAGVVEAIAHSSQGGVYIGGDFTGVHGVPLNRVSRLAPDGEVDTTFDPAGGPDSDVTVMAEQPDGKVLIAGPFKTVNGVPRAGLARLNLDGSLDLTFDPGAGIVNTNGAAFVTTLLPRSDGKIWVAGVFTHVNNHYSRLLARLQPNGTVDSTYTSPFTPGLVVLPGPIPQSFIYSLKIAPDGKLLAGGQMYLGFGLQTTPVTVARLTSAGLFDPSFTLAINRYAVTPTTIAVNPEGRVLSGFLLNSLRGLDTNWLAITRLQTNGTADVTFRVNGLPRMPYSQSDVQQLLVQPDGKILFCTAIYNALYPQIPYQNLPGRAVVGRLLPDGTWDNSFGLISCDLSEAMKLPGPFWFNDPARLRKQPLQPIPTAFLATQPDGILVLAGTFNSVNGEPRRRLARLEPTGALRGRLQLGFSSAQPRELIFPEEIEVPYVVEISTDLAHWIPWLQNDYPWWPLQLPVSTDAEPRFFRARFIPAP